MITFHRRIKRLTRQLENLLGGASGSRQRDGVLQNIAWLALDRGWRMLVGFFVGVAVARSLGPAEMGVMVSALALAALAAAVVELGLDAVLRRELATTGPERRGELLATAALLRMVAVPLGVAALAAGFYLQPPGSGSGALFIALLVAVPLPLLLGFDSWFQSQTQARYVVWAQNGAFLIGSAARIALVLRGAGAVAFVWVTVVETLLVGVFLTALFRRTGQTFAHWRATRATAVALWRDTWPFAVINLSVLAYSRVDVLMLAAFHGEAEAGIYGVATRITDLGFILPMIVISTLLPTLAHLRSTDRAAYHARMQHLCTLITWLSIVTALGLTVIGPWFIRVTYGASFLPAATVLGVSAWTVVFAMQGAARGQWLLLENLQRFGLWYVLIGCLANVSLNYLLIPRFGGLGAATAAVLTQAIVALAAPLLFRATRPGAWLLFNAFVFRTTRL